MSKYVMQSADSAVVIFLPFICDNSLQNSNLIQVYEYYYNAMHKPQLLNLKKRGIYVCMYILLYIQFMIKMNTFDGKVFINHY